MNVMLAMITPRAWAGRLVPVARWPFVIGRAPGCQLRAHTPEVAEQHCALQIRGPCVFVRDLPGSSGTRLNGQPVLGEQQVHNEDRVQVGCLAFTVRLESAPVRPPTKPVAPSEAEEAAASLLLAEDAAEAGDSAVNLAGETLPVEGGRPASVPGVQEPPANNPSPEPPDTSAAAAQLLKRFRKMRGGRVKCETAPKNAP
jgi:predicted component of type VI protein secretion system